MYHYSLKIAGEAGFGITTIGKTFATLCAREGMCIFDYAEFPSLIRGGFTSYEATVSDMHIGTLLPYIDILVVMRQDGYNMNTSRLRQQSIVICDNTVVVAEKNHKTIRIPFNDIKKKHKAFQVMLNTVAMGAICALTGFSFETFTNHVRKEFEKKGEAVVSYNVQLASEGYSYVHENYKEYINIHKIHKKDTNSTKSSLMVLTGNEAFSLGAVVARCKVYTAYPMSPASTVLTTLASWQQYTHMVVRHVEDEIAAVNEALGSSFGGVRTATGSSGGGLALMIEGLSYAGIAEIPLVVFLAQRPGPATGLPTWTAQGDLWLAINAGHGEFPKIVLAPGDIDEMVRLTAHAFDLADIYQTPVFILSDKLLADSRETLDKQSFEDFFNTYRPQRGKIKAFESPKEYLRYADTTDGISPLLVPAAGHTHVWQANSYEHLEDSHTTEDAQETKKQVDKRNRKIQTYLQNHFEAPKVFGNLSEARIIFISWGSSKNVIETTRKNIRISTAHIHFTHIFPLDRAKIAPLFEHAGTYIFVEGNATGQLAQVCAMHGLHTPHKMLLKYDGRPIYQHDIINYLLVQRDIEKIDVTADFLDSHLL